VRVDDVAVGRLAARHLLALGRRRMAHISGPALSPAVLRKRGFTAELRSSGIEIGPELMPRGDFEIEGGRAAMKKLLMISRRPDAVFAANDPMAIGAVYACREAGLEVPGDVSIIGAGNIEGPHHPNPFLTTIDWARVELGRRAAELLISAIRGERPEAAEIVLNPELLVRQSTAARR
jgi:DNA-binding LacI/PurR family transcriptional regulator